jgi:hypothetical protein
MPSATRDIDPADAQDLLERVPRACLAFASHRGPELIPVRLTWTGGRYHISIPENDGPLPDSGQEVVLLVDEGIYYFQLRAIYIRGQVHPAEAPRVAARGHWFEIIPTKIVAWDYGTLHEVIDGR